MQKSSRPLFILGSPRSGTTLLGTVLGSAPNVVDMGEYPGYDFCFRIAPAEMAAMPARAIPEYLGELQQHALSFPKKIAAGSDWHVISAPWNLLVAEDIAKHEPDAVFVVAHRRAEGVCQSLERSWTSGRLWAGKDTQERLDLWCDFYGHVNKLPADRTLMVSFDALCQTPSTEFERLIGQLEDRGFPANKIDFKLFAESHACKGNPQATIGSLDATGAFHWVSRPAWAPDAWSAADAKLLQQHARHHALENQMAAYKSIPPSMA